MEKLCVVRCKRTAADYVPWFLMWILTAVLMFSSFLFSQSFIFFIAVAVIVVNFIFFAPKDISYDYTYYDGEFSIARIRGDNKRKLMCTIQMDVVEKIVPSDDPSLYNAEHEQGVTKKDFSSRNADAITYKMVQRDRGKTTLYTIEPSPDFLDVLCEKYSRIITRRS